MTETGRFQPGDEAETRYWENAVVMKEIRVSVIGRWGRVEVGICQLLSRVERREQEGQ